MLTKADLVKLLKEADGSPILFIGSGLSRRYLGLESWEGLLRHFANLANQGKADLQKLDLPYEFYRDKALSSKNGDNIPDLAYVAEAIEEAFNDTWYRSPNFAASRQEFKSEVQRGISPLKLEIAQYSKEKTILNDPLVKAETDLLRRIGERNIAAIITTNYDTLVEDLFKSFEVFVGQEELLLNHSEGFAEIYKIHGSCCEPDSLVVTRKDYDLFQSQNAYLTAKLMALFWEHPIIFLGYSLSDSNIQNILGSIASCLSDDNLLLLQKRFIFVEWNNSNKDDEIGNYAKSFGAKTIPMTRVCLKDFGTLYEAILSHKPIHRYATALLRKLRNDIYKVVVDAKPSDFIVVNDIDPSTPGDKLKDLKDIKYVIGVGKIVGDTGYTMLSESEIYKDIIFDNLFNTPGFDVSKFVSLTLPNIVKNANGGPLFKHLSHLSSDHLRDVKPRIQAEAQRRCCYEAFFNNTIRNNRRKYQNESITSLRVTYSDLRTCCQRVCNLPEKQMKVEDLNKLLTDTLTQYPDVLDDKTAGCRTDIRRLIKLYDWMVYGQQEFFP